MAAFSFDFSGLNLLTRDLQKIAAGIQKNERAAVKLAGQAYANDVKAIAPYKTGTYRRSIHVEMSTEGIREVALIGTDVPYGRRLEFGFMDTDSLGRKYQQYPRPHWRPTFDHNLMKYRGIMLAALEGGNISAAVEEFSGYENAVSGLRPDLTGGI
jgi:HK97 gp10 family phage protein